MHAEPKWSGRSFAKVVTSPFWSDVHLMTERDGKTVGVMLAFYEVALDWKAWIYVYNQTDEAEQVSIS
jgi:hypothetical protein